MPKHKPQPLTQAGARIIKTQKITTLEHPTTGERFTYSHTLTDPQEGRRRAYLRLAGERQLEPMEALMWKAVDA